MKRAIALVDLDDTLFQTLRKCPDDVPRDALVALGFAKDGSELSYATPRQMHFIAWLTETTHFIPVTARGLDALRRVRIPFGQAICAHGGVILDERGDHDRDWGLAIAEQAAAYAPMLAQLAKAVLSSAALRGVALTARVLVEGDVGLYVLAKHPDADDAELEACVRSVLDQVPPDWTVHANGNNFALMPPFLGKAKAVGHLLPRLRERHPDLPVIGIGDSLTDAPFMAQCDMAMTPTGSQLAERVRRAVSA